ncbi:MAG: ribonuclease P protein component [Candidatus Portnoybacteria bacterium RBG_19FT_COMBO_36_7]|uniref:Ribonuclease P protein component n=1 Tax=Candidatus Portnoybacteria bacterium RBG_19FT_COMBO_36_7 TaxID=1801992 RepID=A0A1G2F670_9BACT|nr:MAG: ribonuclease P protein component [Candidatus Portnoybacteria bacterium RBG_19FT_COMBO_36_7]
MFAKSNRLKKTVDFRNVSRKGMSFSGEFVQIRFLPNDHDSCRFGFVAGLKVSKKAVVRNKIRRRLSETVKLLTPLINKNFDILIFAKTKIAGKNQKEIAKDVENIFKKAGIYNS